MAGVLSQQGITLGNVGTGTVVSLIGAIAAALLGVLAKDPIDGSGPETGGSVSQQRKLGAWAVIALLMPLPFMGGCSGMTVAQNIVDWTPALQSAVASVDSAGAVLSPGDKTVFAAATAGFDAAATLLIAQASAVKMGDLLPLVDRRQAAEMVAALYDEPVELVQIQMARMERLEICAGF